jgi:hypothetical protein
LKVAKQGKITVQHRLRKNLRASQDGAYRLYVRVSVKGKQYDFPSKYYRFDPENTDIDDYLSTLKIDDYFFYLTDDDLKKTVPGKTATAIALEKSYIEKYVRILNPWENDNFSLMNFSKAFQYAINPVSKILDIFLKRDLKPIFNENLGALAKIIDWQDARMIDIGNAMQVLLSKDIQAGEAIKNSPLITAIKMHTTLIEFFIFYQKIEGRRFRYLDLGAFESHFFDELNSYYPDKKLHNFAKRIFSEIKSEYKDRTQV